MDHLQRYREALVSRLPTDPREVDPALDAKVIGLISKVDQAIGAAPHQGRARPGSRPSPLDAWPSPSIDGRTLWAPASHPPGLGPVRDRRVIPGPGVRMLPWYAEELYSPFRYKTLYGGRSSGKTYAMAEALVMQAVAGPIRVACIREFQKSIKESAKQIIEIMIRRHGLDWFFRVNEHTIDGVNGSHFFFQGMERNRESIRGWESVDRVWVEEAQRMSKATWELLVPTIRKPGSEIWLSWNPVNRSDEVWRAFVIEKDTYLRDGGAFIRKINWYDKPAEWIGEEESADRLRCMQIEPERYAHIWLGHPDDEGEDRQVLPFARLIDCVRAYEPDFRGTLPPNAGLDVADTGADWNALVVRRGPVVVHVERWRGHTTTETARRAHARCLQLGMGANYGNLYYDVSGVGAGVRASFQEIRPPYHVEPINFGAAVRGPETLYSYNVKNKDFFGRRAGQLAWTLKLRAENTRRLRKGEEGVDPRLCLFIPDDLPGLERYRSELCQPLWDNSKSGKVEIDKQPDDAPSPDMYDATAMAFAVDSYMGLTASG